MGPDKGGTVTCALCPEIEVLPPFRLEISALVIRRPAIAAIRRSSIEEGEAKATEAVLDIGNRFLEAANLAVSS